jgi:biopolymer transport protein ExbD
MRIPYSTKRRQSRREWLMNLTPLVDVMFHLMIFILVTAQYSNIYTMKVDLPKAEMSQRVGEKKVVVIGLSDEETIFFEQQEVNLEELEGQLSELAKRESPPQVILRADEDSTTGTLVEVMDLVQKVGLRRVSLQTEK